MEERNPTTATTTMMMVEEVDETVSDDTEEQQEEEDVEKALEWKQPKKQHVHDDVESDLSFASDLYIPGSFVVFQGTPGDGLLNTMDVPPPFFSPLPVSPQQSQQQQQEQENASRSTPFFSLTPSTTTTSSPLLSSPPPTTTTTTTSSSSSSLPTAVHQVGQQQEGSRGRSVSEDRGSGQAVARQTVRAGEGISTTGEAHFLRQDQDIQAEEDHHAASVAWMEECRQRALRLRTEWLESSAAEQSPSYPSLHQRRPSSYTQQQSHVTNELHPTLTMVTPWWIHPQTRALATLDCLPQRGHTRTKNQEDNDDCMDTDASNVNHEDFEWPTPTGSLLPGTTVVATKLITLHSKTLQPLHVKPLRKHGQVQAFPRGRKPWIQILQLDNNSQSSMATDNTITDRPPQYVVCSVDGYDMMGPGVPSAYLVADRWLWRVTCNVGAYVRKGLDLSSEHTETLPYGALVQVRRKTVNAMGLSRLQISAVVDHPSSSATRGDHDSNNTSLLVTEKRTIEGWVSEFLNPLSGQRGSILQPLPLPVPAVYRIQFAAGAVLRDHVELSSRQIGQAPMGAHVSVVTRAFSEHPTDKCIERLQLAPALPSRQHPPQNSAPAAAGWISMRLNKVAPDDLRLVDLVGIDGAFDPSDAFAYHRRAQVQLMRQIQQQQRLVDNASPRTVSSIDEDDDEENVNNDNHKNQDRQGEEEDAAFVLVDRNGGNNEPPAQPTATSSVNCYYIPTFCDEILTRSRQPSNYTGNGSTVVVDEATTRDGQPKGEENHLSTSHHSSNNNHHTTNSSNDRCLICLCEERSATVVHGETGHIACCLICARLLKARGDPCPVCRLPIDLVVQHFWA